MTPSVSSLVTTIRASLTPPTESGRNNGSGSIRPRACSSRPTRSIRAGCAVAFTTSKSARTRLRSASSWPPSRPPAIWTWSTGSNSLPRPAASAATSSPSARSTRPSWQISPKSIALSSSVVRKTISSPRGTFSSRSCPCLSANWPSTRPGPASSPTGTAPTLRTFCRRGASIEPLTKKRRKMPPRMLVW
uniref:(northern house mosquito) hypothetical protein n=1 Tax=Culex pipiens TaxID=7175 RepID=A0A8D8B950_CULPI